MNTVHVLCSNSFPLLFAWKSLLNLNKFVCKSLSHSGRSPNVLYGLLLVSLFVLRKVCGLYKFGCILLTRKAQIGQWFCHNNFWTKLLPKIDEFAVANGLFFRSLTSKWHCTHAKHSFLFCSKTTPLRPWTWIQVFSQVEQMRSLLRNCLEIYERSLWLTGEECYWEGFWCFHRFADRCHVSCYVPWVDEVRNNLYHKGEETSLCKSGQTDTDTCILKFSLS